VDHGYEVNDDKRCTARTQKQRQCTLPPVRGIDMCALHAGLARPRGSVGYGDPKALDAYKRKAALKSSQPMRERAR
jgi:hypothetical protein